MDDLERGGVRYLFVNWGSEHPPLIEALARRASARRRWPQPIVCPHETVALSAAQGYAQLTGQPQGVIVHADVGTQNLGGALHNCCRSRTPALIFGGVSPHAVLGEEFGGRNEYQMVLQDVPDQHAIVRQYMKWTYHARSAAHLPMVTRRAFEVAASEPTGPVYLSLSREVLEAPASPVDAVTSFAPAVLGGLRPENAEAILAALRAAQKPLLITTYLGRKPSAVQALVEFSETFAVPVLESFPHFVNFPATHPHHLGFHLHTRQQPQLAQADLVLVVDCDFPWLPANENIRPGTPVFHIDVDVGKERIPLWHVPRTRALAADSGTALRQLIALAKDFGQTITDAVRQARSQTLAAEHERRMRELQAEEDAGRRGKPTAALLAAALREQLGDDDLVLNEAITNAGAVLAHLRRKHPGTLFGSGGSSLGWSGGAALGLKLAAPQRTIVSIIGDGSYIFSAPSAVHWVATRYGLATLTVVLNNGGWRAPEKSTLAIHADGDARRGGTYFNEFKPSVDYVALGKAAGVKFARVISQASELEPALAEALTAVKAGQPALLEIQIEGSTVQRI
ncbi:MAG: thiamine pyrophosphate-requiring protein [Gammaproteobacteria bacterium]|nr:thiamine pyrophosphate-requiring protein [Gammaproteobacteria bacterium]